MKHEIQFAHSNGFPAKCFNKFLDSIENSDINCIELMGHNAYKLNNNLDNLALELIASIEKKFNKPIIGIGHSTGAVLILLAASLKPHLFKKVIVLDPILYSNWKRMAITIMKNIGFSNYIGPVKRTRQRKSVFKTKNEASAYFKAKVLFKNFDPTCFSDYINHGLIKTNNGYELAFSKEIEAEIYRATYTKKPKRIEKLNGTLIFGNKSNMFQKSDANWWKKSYPNFKHIELNTGHLFPLEDPIGTADIINKILKEL